MNFERQKEYIIFHFSMLQGGNWPERLKNKKVKSLCQAHDSKFSVIQGQKTSIKVGICINIKAKLINLTKRS